MRAKLLLHASSLVLLAAASNPAWAQSDAPAESDILVTADRAVIAALRGIQPESEYGAADAEAYGSSTVGEFIYEIMAQNGDEDPVFLVDGELVSGIDDVGDFPAEAVERLEVLPRGTSQRVGGRPNERVYNLALKQRVRSLTASVSDRFATEGGWAERKGDAIVTRIAGRDRLNLTLRVRDSGPLYESDRGIVQPGFATSLPVVGFDPAEDTGAFRTLRSDSRSYDARLVGNKRLAPWLSVNFGLDGRLSRDVSASGLPSADVLLPASHPGATSGADQLLLAFGSAALERRYESDGLGADFTANATRGSWIAALSGNYNMRNLRNESDRLQLAVAGPPVVPADLDPFAGPIDALFPLYDSLTDSRERTSRLRFNVGGPVLPLPAGALRVRLAAEAAHQTLRSTRQDLGPAIRDSFGRSEWGADGGIDIPLASRAGGFLPVLGELSLSLDHRRAHVRRVGTIARSAASTLWQPIQQLSITASWDRERQLPDAAALADPLLETENARIFDVLTGETVDVTYLSGGNPALRPARERNRRMGVSGAPWQKIALQLRADYQWRSSTDSVVYLSPASPALVLAFPDRFIRDAAGRLVRVDGRPVNFDSHTQRELRYGLSFSLPIGAPPPSSAASFPRSNDEGSDSFAPLAQGARTRLQATANHALVLSDEVVLRPGLAPLDLLAGGATGIGGGRVRHVVDGSVAIAGSGFGTRLTGQWRGASSVTIGAGAAAQQLHFAPQVIFNLSAFTQLSRIAPRTQWLKSTRLTLSVTNLGNRRQRVSDAFGATPLRFQPGYRDPVGRTFELELRTIF